MTRLRKLRKHGFIILTLVMLVAPFFLALIPLSKADVYTYTGFGGDYCLYYDDGDVTRWTNWGNYWIDKTDDLHDYGLDYVTMIFGFYGSGNHYGSLMDYTKFDTMLDYFDGIDVPVIAYLLDAFWAYPSNYFTAGTYEDDWVDFATEFQGDSRIAAFSLFSEVTSSYIPTGWSTGDMAEHFANVSDAIHAVDSTRQIIFPCGQQLYNATYTVADWITDVQATGVDADSWVVFDALHPYFFEDPYGWDMGLTPAQKAAWYETNYLDPMITAFGADDCYCGETFAAYPGSFSWTTTEANQVAFETAMINVFVDNDVGFDLLSTLGSTGMYDWNLAALIASEYEDPTPTPTPTATPTPTPTITPGPTPTPTPTPSPPGASTPIEGYVETANAFALAFSSGDDFNVQDIYHSAMLNFEVQDGSLTGTGELNTDISGGELDVTPTASGLLYVTCDITACTIEVNGIVHTVPYAYTSGSAFTVEWTWTASGTTLPEPIDFWGLGGDVAFLLAYLERGDLLGFIIACYTSRIGQMFYVILILCFTVPLALRTQSITYVAIVWLICGALLIPAVPLISPAAVLLLIMGIAGLIYRAYTRE